MELPSSDCPSGTTGWRPDCAPGLTNHVECKYQGFQYSMEWYFSQMLQDNVHYLAAQPERARYVYFPQCVSQVYFDLRMGSGLTHWEAIAAAEARYLVPLLRWAHESPLHRRHDGRNFWTVFSMDLGRQDFPRSAAWLEHWSVGSLTGDERWLSRQQALLAVPGAMAYGAGEGSCWQEDTVPVTVASEMFPARNFREQDTVISIPSRFEPSDRSRAFGGRPTLAFFGGSPNSCARRRVLELYSRAAGFDVSSNFLNDEEYQEKMWSSRFCLVMRGSSHTNNVRLYEVMAHGCVPVVISDDFQPPLDSLLPWREIALFLPTAAIPRLGHILRHEVDEAARWRLFQNLALGSSEADGARARQLVAQAERRLDLDTLWGGLSAASVFNWARSDFWILFLADVAEKLGGRVDRAGPRELRGPAAPGGGAAAGAEGGFRWHREAWWAAERRGEEASAAAAEGRAEARREAAGDGRLLSGLHWLLGTLQRREGRSGAPPGRWLLVDCAADGAPSPARWLEALGGGGAPQREAGGAAGRCASPQGSHPAVASFAVQPSERALAGALRADASEGPGPAHGAREAEAPPRGVFVLRVGRRCRGAAGAVLAAEGAGSLPVKLLLAEQAELADQGLVNALASAPAAWLCFALSGDGPPRPVFSPFAPLAAPAARLLCGREGDADLDALVRLLQGAVGAGPPPARWGASPEGGAAGGGAALARSGRGRFLYSV